MTTKHYLLFVSHSYAYSILRPLEEEINKRNCVAAWYLEDTCEDLLHNDELRLNTLEEVMRFNPIAVFSPGNWVYDFFPGVKVEVFHGYPMHKRIEKVDDHFKIRGWFDIYCTQGESSTPYFKYLEKKYGYFKIYETGWCKVDSFYNHVSVKSTRPCPTILYAPTFSKGISSVWEMEPVIEQISLNRPWKWIITFHPKLTDSALLDHYEALAERHNNIEFRRINKGLDTFKDSDVLLCDSSSIIVEYMMLNKPVVTYRNTHPGDFLINVLRTKDIEPAIEKALSRPPKLMDNAHDYTLMHERHRDGKNSARVLEAVDDFIRNYQGQLKRKPFNLIRRLKLYSKIDLNIKVMNILKLLFVITNIFSETLVENVLLE